jgi:hypothetical protein
MSRRLGVVPIPAFIGLIASLDILLPISVAVSLAYNPAIIFGALQTIFLFGTGCLVAYVSLRAYLSAGSRTVLLLGAGTLAWGAAQMVGAWLLAPPGGPNLAITVANTGSLFAGLFHVMSASSTHGSGRDSRSRFLKSTSTYGLVIGFLILLTVLAFMGATPAFFVPGTGSTQLRLVVVAATLFLFSASALVFVKLYHDSKSGILFWYSMALALTAVGLGAFYLARVPGDPIAWAGRTATYLGGIYSIIAVWSAIHPAPEQR